MPSTVEILPVLFVVFWVIFSIVRAVVCFVGRYFTLPHIPNLFSIRTSFTGQSEIREGKSSYPQTVGYLCLFCTSLWIFVGFDLHLFWVVLPFLVTVLHPFELFCIFSIFEGLYKSFASVPWACPSVTLHVSYRLFSPVHAGFPGHRVITQLHFVGVHPVPTATKTRRLL